jgi:hypothetical protein
MIKMGYLILKINLILHYLSVWYTIQFEKTVEIIISFRIMLY